MATLGELAEEFGKLVLAKKQAATKESEITAEIASLEEELLDKMAEEGIRNLSLSSGMTLYQRVEKFYSVAEGHDKAELVRVMANCPQTMDLVEANYNANKLKSRMREIEENGEPLPPELVQMLKITERYRVGHRS